MSFAVELYTDLRKAISLKGVAELLKKVFAVEVTYESIRQWVLAAKNTVLRRGINSSECWHADETYIKIKGIGFWLWLVYDEELILAWHISKKRLHKDAKIVLQKALDVTGIRPEQIITDGLYQYQSAIKKVIGWNWKEQKVRHVIDSGIGKNAILERLNREVKRRIRWFNTFQSLEGAKAFFGLWCYHYNQRKSAHTT